MTTVDGDEVVTARHMENIMAPPFWRMALRGNNLADDVPVDRWQIRRFTPAQPWLIEVGVAQAGNGGYHAAPQFKASEHRGGFHHARNRDVDLVLLGHGPALQPQDEALTASIREGQGKIFSEDLKCSNANSETCWTIRNANLLKLNIDAGGVQSRRVLERWIAREREAQAGLIASSHQPQLAEQRPLIEVHVAARHNEALDICSYELTRVYDGEPLPAFTAGAHIDVHLPGGLIRQYSLCNHPEERHRYLIGVLKDPTSRGVRAACMS